MGVALGTAFSTASSSASLPVTIDCVENKANIRSETAGIVLPMGATINMDGTALYEAVAAIFIAYVSNVPLDFYSMLLIFLTSTLAAIGAAGIPEAGLVTMTIVLNSVGLPLEGITLILSIDWFLDRCRTAINVLGDTIGAAIIDRID
jgi:Na+/H+-dicarboxylate symporter